MTITLEELQEMKVRLRELGEAMLKAKAAFDKETKAYRRACYELYDLPVLLPEEDTLEEE